METYGEGFDELVLVLRQVAKNGVLVGANRDVLWADNYEQTAAAKATVAERMKAAIFLNGANVQKYKQLKDDL